MWCKVLVAVGLVVTSTSFCACETTRKAEARRREEMDTYSFSYSYRRGGNPSLQDKRTLRELEGEGWRPVQEERSTKDDRITITMHFER